MNQQLTIVPGSIAAVAQQQNKSIAESFASAANVAIVDTSGSMGVHDSRGERSRYDVACEELASLQGSLPGQIAVLSFSDTVMFCPNGTPINLGGGTALDAALKFARVADTGQVRFIVISDGSPNDPDEALAEARQFKGRIDVVYVGPEGGSGQKFLTKLAQATGGQGVTAAQAKELAATIKQLLLAA